ncbi:sacsin N-terminal ATP-binding-like domain-containing protein [Ornithinimicrobium avium]|uniref:sacsin N-terminal ATP-binding-like domain-containing protein n=1 Tax=Ornithinimicrobium avium TaxID=2283195 RepID=UPI0038991F76
MDAETAARAEHTGLESVRITSSFARAERLLGGEYHGRFLIELLQNASDAWRGDPRSIDGSRSRAAVILTEEPALVVANQGIDLQTDVVIGSLGHIGASTKAEGEAIGHKGIGFKSVLEITARPEIYSGLQDPKKLLAVRFDPGRALEQIKKVSPDWDAYLERTAALDRGDPHSAIPALRYPFWVDDVPHLVEELAAEGFDTVVRLPFDEQLAARRGRTKEDWLTAVRTALANVSDEILLLLGTFSEVTFHDQADGGDVVCIAPSWSSRSRPPADAEASDVRIERTGRGQTVWRLYRRTISGHGDLAGEIAVGVRLAPGGDRLEVVPAVDGSTSAPFHLFFPTRIPSGMPFLLHGYFQVDASRTGFHGAAEGSNRRILDELAVLVRDVVLDLSGDGTIESTSVVNLVAECPTPEDELASGFRDRVLSLLDDESWVPVEQAESAPSHAMPRDVLAGHPRFTRLVASTFPADYVHARTGLSLMHQGLNEHAIDLVAARQMEAPGMWNLLAELSRPGDLEVWGEESADEGFRGFLRLVNWLTGEFPTQTERFLGQLRGSPSSRLVPVVSASGGRVLLPVPDPTVGLTGRRSQLVMARIRSRGERALVPPVELQVSFLADGLLSSDEINRARPLGIRPFTVDNVLDRLGGLEVSDERAEHVLTFVWQFLARERTNQYGTRRLVERAAAFSPQEWFWCRPGRARESDTRRQEQQRERYLADVMLPNRDGAWRPAGSLCFGEDWSTWLESLDEDVDDTDRRRGAAYRALERVCPAPGKHLLAHPDVVLPMLAEIDLTLAGTATPDEEPEQDDEYDPDEADWDRERHAFLLRLGVWEVLPVEAFESRDRRDGREKFVWSGPVADRQQQECTTPDGWTFGLGGWSGEQHHNVYLGEDFRFQWSLAEAARRDASAVTELIDAGRDLYARCLQSSFFCPACNDSGTGHTVARHSNVSDGYPSWVALQLRSEPWIPVHVAGESLPTPVEPGRAWWLERVPSEVGLMTSPWRFVPVCGPNTGVSETVRNLGRVNTADDADLQAVSWLLRHVRDRFEADEIDLGRTTDRQAFVSLHTAMYDRLASAPEGAGRAVLEDVGVLSTLGSALTYAPVDDTRHDDGRFSAYVRHFADRIPLAVIRRDRQRAAEKLGIARFEVDLRRRGDDDGRDVTGDLVEGLHARAPELLGILVHHSLGAQPLTLDSENFRQRAQRLMHLQVRQVPRLVVEATVDGVETVLLGDDTSGDLFLEGGTTARPVLYHDFTDDAWRERVRRHLWLHLATLLEAPAYAHTFALFLQYDTDAEREVFLLELGISQEDVDAVRAQLGLVSETEQANRRRWFTALLRVLTSEAGEAGVEGDQVRDALLRAGLPRQLVTQLLSSGGGGDVRRDTSRGSPLRLLDDYGVDLRELDAQLRKLGHEEGLHITDARRRLQKWTRAHGRRLVAVLVRAGQLSPGQAIEKVRQVSPPASLGFAVDPPLGEVLAEIGSLLAPGPPATVAGQLADDPPDTLAELGGYASVDDLDADVRRLYDVDEQRYVLRSRAVLWNRAIRKLAVLTRMTPTETRAGIRALDDEVAEQLKVDLDRPSQLVEAVEQLLADTGLAERIVARLDDDLLGAGPDEDELHRWAAEAGIDEARLARYDRALRRPRNAKAARLRSRADELKRAEVRAAVPAHLVVPAHQVRASAGRKGPEAPDQRAPGIRVSKIKVTAEADRRKREHGDEGEQWALADTVAALLALDDEARALAVEDVRGLLERFDAAATEDLLAHAAAASAPREDEEDDDLIEALEGLLHVSRVSDGFGFDMVGWVAPAPDQAPCATALEVKSTSGDRFQLSSNEWRIAQALREQGAGERYAVLAVRRRKGGGVPAGMDLLVDPVHLHEVGLLTLDTSNYVAKYATGG